jgi:hypothetical protein
MPVRPVQPRDRAEWLRMRQTLWTDDETLEAGIEAHQSLGFAVTERLVCFLKRL